MGIFDKKHLYH